MDREDRGMVLRQAKEIFFDALLDGYGGDQNNTKKETSLDGYKTLTFPAEGSQIGFVVVDRYCVTPHSNKSAGTTTIFYNGEPVWWMSYAGEYPEEIIPFLKRALQKAYEGHEFIGGRGPIMYDDHDGTYLNQVCEGCFTHFSGIERIYDDQGKHVGYHKYFGMSLI